MTEEEMIVKIGCNPMRTNTNQRDFVAARACTKHHEPATPQRSTIAIK